MLASQKIERVHLALLECLVARAEQVVAQRAHRGTTSNLNPRRPDLHCEFVHLALVKID